MDLYRIYVCLTAEDERIAAAYQSFGAADLSCLHLPLPSPRAAFCCRQRRLFFKRLRLHLRDGVPPRKSRDLKLPTSFWSTSADALATSSFSGPHSPLCGSEVIADAGLQLHRLFDYFNPQDASKQLEVVCCLSASSLSFIEGNGADSLLSSLLRAVEFQDGRVVFAADAAAVDSKSCQLLKEWCLSLSAQLLIVDAEGCCRWADPVALSPIWRGSLQFGPRQVTTRVANRLRGVQLLRLPRGSKEELEAGESVVPVIPGRWIECWRSMDDADFCPLLASHTRLSLCLQSSDCNDAANFLRLLRQSGGLFCRLPLYPASATFEAQENGGEDDKAFMPPSDRWANQLLNEIRMDASPAPSFLPSVTPPCPLLSLSLLLLPSSSYTTSADVAPGLLPCDVIVLRQSWQLPIPVLLKAATGAPKSARSSLDAALAEAIGGESSPADRSSEDEARTTMALELTSQLSAHTLRRHAGRKSGGGTRQLQPMAKDERSKESEGSDHLIEQILSSFKPDGAPSFPPLEIVKPLQRTLIDNIEDASQLDWPKAANVFYHGIFYNRGCWSEEKEERLARLQAAAIPQETMCTVTRFGCRGSLATTAPPVVPEKRARRVVITQNAKKKTEKPKVPLSRSQRHEEKLRAVVSAVLTAEGISPSDSRYPSTSKKLFAATLTMLKLQNLPNSRNLREKMREAAYLQFQVIKQLSDI